MRFTSFEELARNMEKQGQKKDGAKNPKAAGTKPASPRSKQRPANQSPPTASKQKKGTGPARPQSGSRSPANTPAQEREPDEESRLFQQAMQGVRPLKANGRQVPAPTNVHNPPAPDQSEAEAKAYLRELVQGNVEFELEHTSEFIEGHVRGLDQRKVRKLKAGQYSFEAHLDLHGANTDGAKLELLEFVRSQYLLGRRCLLIIPGRGRNSPQGRGVLRDEVQAWLTQDPLKRVVLAFATALPRHGGAGALYVLLRKYKKSHGKILWQKYPLNSET
ncbi:Smr/MutS family protein [Desulfohalobium retbaense]|uniref:Smr protein/MutS2 n=1 Tax=Desulfohalobium retbaense (strain ATCC 49708 / DSM 5692 / JCM 16813 / HR100) TaxID=485915 RepID=C8X3G6_DESRD|nr:Smr/MutS family protein [Desulfohalobium retbaense]ACV68963.1 Smr protein/MutS2 [Desulfohalobium retbaense DSM 5692]